MTEQSGKAVAEFEEALARYRVVRRDEIELNVIPYILVNLLHEVVD